LQEFLKQQELKRALLRRNVSPLRETWRSNLVVKFISKGFPRI